MKPEERIKNLNAKLRIDAVNIGCKSEHEINNYIHKKKDEIIFGYYKKEYNPRGREYSGNEIRNMKILRDFLSGLTLTELAELYEVSSSRIGIIIKTTAKKLYKNHKDGFLWELGIRNALNNYSNYLIEKINKKIGV